jgi:hypothetical protein
MREFKALFEQIGSVTYVILYTIFAILFYTNISKEILNSYAHIINPLMAGLGLLSFYKGASDNYIEQFNINYERIKMIILLIVPYMDHGNNFENYRRLTQLKDYGLLKDKDKNPSGFHRCWASINNKDDELWKISKPLFESDVVIFFGSVRWGQTNSFYQKLIERLTWIENRRTTLGEGNIVEKIDAGIILLGQNWNGRRVLNDQKEVFKFFI